VNLDSSFRVHHLRFEVEATTPLVLVAPSGPKLRAALFDALGMVCPLRGNANAPPEHKATCPVCWLLATEKPGHERGKDLPRPLTLEPPLDLARPRLEAGERFAFGLSLCAQAANLFPYLALGVPEMGRRGLGRPLPELDGQRGRFALRRVEAVNPLSGARQVLLEAAQGPLFQVPAVPVTMAQVQKTVGAVEDRLAGDEWQVTLQFLTPTRIVERGQLVHRPRFAPLFARLFDRLVALSRHYADAPLAARADKPALMALADRVQQEAEGRPHWREAHSYSRRLGRTTPVSGFVGRAVYCAPRAVWRELLPYLLWGQSVHVGKSTTKGDGWYEVGEWLGSLEDNGGILVCQSSNN
jgi:hypothetical protein